MVQQYALCANAALLPRYPLNLSVISIGLSKCATTNHKQNFIYASVKAIYGRGVFFKRSVPRTTLKATYSSVTIVQLYEI